MTAVNRRVAEEGADVPLGLRSRSHGRGENEQRRKRGDDREGHDVRNAVRSTCFDNTRAHGRLHLGLMTRRHAYCRILVFESTAERVSS